MNAYVPRSSLLSVSRVGMGIGFLLVFLALIPLSPAQYLFKKAALSQSNACATTEREIVVKSAENFTSRQNWRCWPALAASAVRPVGGASRAGIRKPTSVVDKRTTPCLLAGSALIYAVQRNRDEAGLIVPIHSPRPLPEVSPNAVWSLCLDKRPSNVRLGDFLFWPLERVVVHGSQ